MLNPISLNILLIEASEKGLTYFQRDGDYWFIGSQLARQKGLNPKNFSRHYTKEEPITKDCKIKRFEGEELRDLKRGFKGLDLSIGNTPKLYCANSTSAYYYLIRGLKTGVKQNGVNISPSTQLTYFYLLGGCQHLVEITKRQYKFYFKSQYGNVRNNLKRLIDCGLVQRKGRGYYFPKVDLTLQQSVEDLLLKRLGFGICMFQELIYIARSFYPEGSLEPHYHLFLLQKKGDMSSYDYETAHLEQSDKLITRTYCQLSNPKVFEERATKGKESATNYQSWNLNTISN